MRALCSTVESILVKLQMCIGVNWIVRFSFLFMAHNWRATAIETADKLKLLIETAGP